MDANGMFDDKEFPAANYGMDNYYGSIYNSLGYSLNGNHTNVFSDWLFPQSKEGRQDARQLEMDKIEPSAKMEGMIRAGINPLTAANGIAGSSSSASMPASSVNPIGDVAGAAGALASPVGGIMSGLAQLKQTPSIMRKNDAEANKVTEEAGVVQPLAQANMLRSYAAAAKDLTDAGIDEATAAGVAFDSCTSGLTSGISNLLRGDGIVRRIDKEIRKYDDEHQNVWHDILLKQDELKKNEYRIPKEEYEMQMAGIQLERERLAKERDNLLTEQWKRFDGDPALDQASRLYDIQTLHGFNSPQYKAAMRIAYDTNYYSSLAGLDAQVETAYDKAFNEFLGENAANAEYAPFFTNLEMHKDIIKNIYQEAFKSPKGFLEALCKLAQLPAFASMGAVLTIGQHHIHKPKTLPHAAPTRDFSSRSNTTSNSSSRSNTTSHSFRW